MNNLSKLLIVAVFVVSMVLPVFASNMQEDLLFGVIQGTVLKVTETDQSTMLHIKGKAMNENSTNEIVLHLFEATQIMGKKQNELTINDIKVGAKVEATFGPVMTRSLPPQSQARSITVISSSSLYGFFLSIKQLLSTLL